MSGRGLRRVWGAVRLWLPLAAWLGFVLAPYAWMFITSIKPPDELYTKVVDYWPRRPTFEGYRLLLETTPFLTYMRNSGIVALSTCAVALVVAVSAAYCFSRLHFRGKGVLLFGFLVTQLFPSVLLVLPLFLIMRTLGILNTPPALILAHSTFAVPFSTWLLTGFFNAIPRELDEAATIDGCSRLQAFRFVLLPLSAPGLAAALTYIFIYSWNEFIYALTFTADLRARTIPVGLQTFMGEFIIRWDLLTAGGVITALPIVFFFMLVQRHLIAGLTAGAVKG
jgi:multiple sugar transport system permease protein